MFEGRTGGAELLEALKKTGSTDACLWAGQRVVEQQGHCDGAAVVRALEGALASGCRKTQPGTIQKARALMEGEPLERFMGKPPPDGEESRIEKMAHAMAESVGERVAHEVAKIAPGKLPRVKVAEGAAQTTAE